METNPELVHYHYDLLDFMTSLRESSECLEVNKITNITIDTIRAYALILFNKAMKVTPPAQPSEERSQL